MSFPEKLAYLKRKQHMTAETLSTRSGIPLGTLNKILSGATRNPSMMNMDAIARVFNVPIRYLIEDSLPVEFDLSVYAESEGLVCLSNQELSLVERYRSLPEHERHIFTQLMDSLLPIRDQAGAAGRAARRLPCYVPVAEGLRGAFLDALKVCYLMAEFGPVTLRSDFAVMLTGLSMEPVYRPGTVLGVKAQDAAHNQLGIFLLNGEGFVRKLYRHRGVHKLVATNRDLKDILIQPEDELRCMGVVVGALRKFHWV